MVDGGTAHHRRMRLLLLALILPLAMTSAAPLPARAGPRADARADPVGVWPLRPRPAVVAAFDPPDVVWGAGHRGVDLAGQAGQPVRTALPGQVRFSGRIAGRGVVVVGHGSTRTTYEPVAAAVHVGDPVEAGDVLGRLELAGSHCFPRACLHWGWVRGETYLDPLRLVGGGPVRLLPLWRDSPAGTPGPAGHPGPAIGGPALGGPVPMPRPERPRVRPAGALAGTPAAVGRW